MKENKNKNRNRNKKTAKHKQRQKQSVKHTNKHCEAGKVYTRIPARQIVAAAAAAACCATKTKHKAQITCPASVHAQALQQNTATISKPNYIK